MIGVLTASTISGSVLGYDLGDLKNKDQKIRILSFEGVFLDARQVDRLNQNWTDESSRKEFKYISRSVANDLAHQFDSQASMNDRIVRTTGHISLSFSPADLPKLDDESMVKYAEEGMDSCLTLKRNIPVLEELHKELIAGGLMRGYDKEALEEVWKSLDNYDAFMKAHALCYTWLSYQTAWLKAHYPKEFFTDLLNANIQDEFYLEFYISDCEAHGFAVTPPDKSDSGCFEVSD